ncbi:hypothetical protein J6590_009192 [Homalodisca vitripennis]|nr:hypothetical protein J6590_009192 [Homalodisca vitripennis]
MTKVLKLQKKAVRILAGLNHLDSLRLTTSSTHQDYQEAILCRCKILQSPTKTPQEYNKRVSVEEESQCMAS